MENNKSTESGAGSGRRYFIPEKIKTIKSADFDYVTIWTFLFLKGIEIYGKKFKFFDDDTEIILKLITWF